EDARIVPPSAAHPCPRSAPAIVALQYPPESSRLRSQLVSVEAISGYAAVMERASSLGLAAYTAQPADPYAEVEADESPRTRRHPQARSPTEDARRAPAPRAHRARRSAARGVRVGSRWP